MGVSNPEAVGSVVIFFRLKDNQTGTDSGWDSGTALNPSSDRTRYTREILGSSLPGATQGSQQTVLYQLVVTGPDGKTLGRSPVFSDVQAVSCSGIIQPGVTLQPGVTFAAGDPAWGNPSAGRLRAPDAHPHSWLINPWE